MKIRIKQTFREPWGRLSIEDARTASRILSGDAFKVWVNLSLNQGGYTFDGDIEVSVMNELTDTGYLTTGGSNALMFSPSGNNEEADSPEQWQTVVKLYGMGSTFDYQYIIDKLASMSLSDQSNEILSYWVENYKELQGYNRSNAKNILRYDFSIVLAWWLKENFKFEIGDVIVAGYKGERLRYHNDFAKKEICRSLAEHGDDRFVIHERNKPYWDEKVGNGIIELRLEDVGQILRCRKNKQ